MEPVVAYCLKCKSKHAMKDPAIVEKNGRKMMQGMCEKHNTKMSLIVSNKS